MPSLVHQVPAHFYRLLILNSYLTIVSLIVFMPVLYWWLWDPPNDIRSTQRKRYNTTCLGLVSSIGGLVLVLQSYGLGQDFHYAWSMSDYDTLSAILGACVYAQIVLVVIFLYGCACFYKKPATFAKRVRNRRVVGERKYVDGYAYTFEVRAGAIDNVYDPVQRKRYHVW